MLAIVVAVVVLALVVWLVVALTGGGDTEPEPAAAQSTLTSSTEPSSSAAETTSTQSDGSDGEGDTSSGSGGSTSGTTTADSPEESGAETTAAAVPPGQCPDQSLAVRVTADEPNYQTGTEPGFTIVITNIGTAQCDRDLGAGLQQVLVYTLDGNERLWSNTDCFPEPTSDMRTLQPGDQAAYSVKWSASTSEPGCASPREPVGPGAYTVVGQLGGLRSTPEPFNITP
jgi:hypothetical protein|nr:MULTISPECIES: hypothetical protein [unclassified Rhodococcus (in: high G+C Gram-positive bacteria)]